MIPITVQIPKTPVIILWSSNQFIIRYGFTKEHITIIAAIILHINMKVDTKISTVLSPFDFYLLKIIYNKINKSQFRNDIRLND